jgi:D-alanyl-D-alanine carboxypeptidase/D-alanyl-D-alanine-endopeptidase (penicillin-binding protein 4)
VAVEGPVGRVSATLADPVVAALVSAPVPELVADMLTRSDNEIAEALLREMGGGPTAVGATAVDTALRSWCLHLDGVTSDGSGLSRADGRSARDLRRLLQVATEQEWSEQLLAGLPVAGRSGTLARRLRGASTEGNVRAKTGTIIGGSSLSGYATTSDGRALVFSVLVNAEPSVVAGATPAIDRLVAAAVGP